jgi:hypothetical protein
VAGRSYFLAIGELFAHHQQQRHNTTKLHNINTSSAWKVNPQKPAIKGAKQQRRPIGRLRNDGYVRGFISAL